MSEQRNAWLNDWLAKHGQTLEKADGTKVRIVLPNSLKHIKTVADLANHVRETERNA